jgi:hypothetical protein
LKAARFTNNTTAVVFGLPKTAAFFIHKSMFRGSTSKQVKWIGMAETMVVAKPRF